MRAGKLRHMITVERFSETLDAYGTPILDWSALAKLRAEIVQQSTEEFLRDHGASDEATVVFRTRYLDSVTTADRIKHAGIAHNIREIAPDPLKRSMELRCVTVEAE